MSKVFMDGGSGLNLIFATTLRAMNIYLTNLEATDTSFHGIVLGKPEVPLGKLVSTSSLGRKKIIGGKGLSSKWWTGHHSITPSLVDQPSRASWLSRTTRISWSRWQDLEEPSLSAEASLNQIIATRISTKFQNSLVCNRSLQASER